MSEVIIAAENLSKHYLIHHELGAQGYKRYTALRDVIGEEVGNLARRALGAARGRKVLRTRETEEFWALKDVNFEVKRGEVLGIIGRNGAGKSTLLKILSRITEPTAGRVTLRGRVASLLEVGTGFHPELTGRENIYLNGAILGMSHAEIRRKFDEIVTFAETERFLDTPVKRYSSGMYVRLAFAVAAHLEPEILVVDEVLAVGDAEFQKKCLGKMDEVSRREGRTVLFVSHNMRAITEFASRAILLDRGSVAIDGSISEAVSAYLSKTPKKLIYVTAYDEQHEPPHVARAEVLTSLPSGVQHFGEPLHINVWIRHVQPLARACLGVHLVNQLQASATAVHALHPDFIFAREPGTTLIRFLIPKLRLNVGRFHLRIYLTEQPPGGKVYEIVDEACGFEVVRQNFFSWWGPETCAYLEEFTVEITEQLAISTHSERRRTASMPGD